MALIISSIKILFICYIIFIFTIIIWLDDGASINDRYVLNPDTPDTASIHLSDLSDDSELARVVGVRQIDEYERQPGDPETSTLTSSTSFFSSGKYWVYK